MLIPTVFKLSSNGRDRNNKPCYEKTYRIFKEDSMLHSM
jgi:hypothetical protein